MKTPKQNPRGLLTLITQYSHVVSTVKKMQLPPPSLRVHGQRHSYHRRDVLGHFYPFLIIFCAFVQSLDCELQKTPDDLQSLCLTETRTQFATAFSAQVKPPAETLRSVHKGNNFPPCFLLPFLQTLGGTLDSVFKSTDESSFSLLFYLITHCLWLP